MKLSVASPTRKSLLTAAAHIAFTLSAIVTSTTLTTAWAGPTDDDDANTAKTNARDIRDTVVVMGENDKAAAAAPSMSTLEATEPQSVVSQDFIDYSQPRTADFVSLLQITPSAGGLTSSNGPGLGEAKTTLRGFKDGEYNITFDGIPFGDTNNPTHHSTSFFPAADIGQIVVERGPGNASNLGQASFGGTVMLGSRALSDTQGFSQSMTYGTWNTLDFVTAIQTGKLLGDNKAHAMLVLHEIKSDGATTNSPVEGQDQMLKADISFLDDRLRLTGLVTHDYNTYYQADSTSGLTLAKAAVVGKDYALGSDPRAPDYFGYNATKKQTWFAYLRADFDLSDAIRVQDTPYYYWYDNATLSADDVTSDPNGVFAAAAVRVFPTRSPLTGAAAAAQNGFTTPPYGAPSGVQHISGYDKQNHYGVYGNILKVDLDTGFGKLTTGLWSEYADTDRHQFTLDVTTRAPNYKNNGAAVRAIPQDINYLQNSGWTQQQPFVEFEWKPLDNLTVTPGVKYIMFRRRVNAEVNQTSRTPTDFGNTWTTTLPFLTANYRLGRDWSVYAQYAKGFLAPDLNTTYVARPAASAFNPQTSTNYQIGTVFRSDNLVIDGDIYQVDFNDKVVQFAPGQVVNGVTLTDAQFFNIGGVQYRGVELQATYAFDSGLALFVNGSKNDAIVKDSPVPANNGLQLNGAPEWTAAAGVMYNSGPFRASLIHKLIGTQYASLAEVNKIDVLETTGLNASYLFDALELSVGINNLFDKQDIVSISGNPPATGAVDARRYGFQAGRSVQVTAKVSF